MTVSTRLDPKRTPSQSSAPRRDALAALRIDRPDPRDARKSGRKWLWIIGFVLLFGGGYFGYRHLANRGWDSGSLFGNTTWVPEIMQKRIEVRLAPVTVQQGRAADAVVVATGYLESRQQAKIGARASGRIETISFEEGDRVDQGAILAELEHKDLDASLAAAAASVDRARAALAEQEIAIEQAKVDRDRADELRRSATVAESEYDLYRFTYQIAVARKDTMQAEIELAEAQRQQAEQMKENMFIRAPFAGTVISKDAELGESILPGGMGQGSGRGSVATIADLDHLQIECDVREDFISRVTEGQDTEIAVDAVPNKKYHGTVRKIIPMGDRARATIKVQVDINDADGLLFPEMSGTVFFLPSAEDTGISQKPRYFVPSSAVDRDEQHSPIVWIVDSDKRARAIAVQAGDQRDGRIEIINGLTGDERVIVNPQDVQDGVTVQIIE